MSEYKKYIIRNKESEIEEFMELTNEQLKLVEFLIEKDFMYKSDVEIVNLTDMDYFVG